MTSKEENRLNKGVYDGKYSTENLPEFLFLFTFNELINEVEKGYGKTKSFVKGSKKFKKSLKFRTNINVFSGAKTYQNVVDLSNAVIMPDGKKAAFSDFKKVATRINDNYNKNWLKAEQNMALQQSISAKEWDSIQETKEDLPMLKYLTVGDARVRPEHAAWDGIVKPVDDSFWNTHMPPNDWGCRCEVVKVEQQKETNLKDHLKKYNKNAPENAKVKSLVNDNKLFANNPGKHEFIFDPNEHPYFKNIPRDDKKNNFGFGFV